MEMFSRFERRIRITAKGHPLEGKTGTIERLRLSDDGAWVAMDKPLPEELASFPMGDGRRNHFLLYPDDCEVA